MSYKPFEISCNFRISYRSTHFSSEIILEVLTGKLVATKRFLCLYFQSWIKMVTFPVTCFGTFPLNLNNKHHLSCSLWARYRTSRIERPRWPKHPTENYLSKLLEERYDLSSFDNTYPNWNELCVAFLFIL